MKRVVQSRTGADGNCLNACVASILELPLKDVPEFGEDWLRNLNRFLSEYGLSYRRVPMYKKPSGWSTIEGISPRGGLHACVALDGELTWDPHPIEDGTGQGLVEPRYYGLLEPLKSSAKDRADMATLRRNTEQQGGSFFMQVTEKDGREHTTPVREVSKAVDSQTTRLALLLAAVYAWYKKRQEPCETYDLTNYVPKRRSFDGLPLNRYQMHELLDALGIDIKEFMRRTEQQKTQLLRTAIERLDEERLHIPETVR